MGFTTVAVVQVEKSSISQTMIENAVLRELIVIPIKQ